jgi:hypothetical protein
MMSLIDMGPGVLAPMLAGALLPIFGLTGILSLDVTTFLLAILILFFVHIPQPPPPERVPRHREISAKRQYLAFDISLPVRACWACNLSSSLEICVPGLRLPSSPR